jgi:hypothetical protein
MKGHLPKLRHLCFHPSDSHWLVISSFYLGAGLFVNFFVLQVLCMPVWWAAVLFLFSSLAILFFPWLKRTPIFPLASMLLGLGVWVYLYIGIFLLLDSDANTFAAFLLHLAIYVAAIFFFGAGLFAFLPIYFLFHIYKYYKSLHRPMFYAGLCVPMFLLVPYLSLFNDRYKEFDRAVSKQQISTLPKDYFTERFLAIGLKYHTALNYMYDGWRPPLHDPLLNIGLWLFSDTYYPHRFLTREQYYTVMFPHKAVKVWCPCSYSKDGRTYFSK